MGNHKSRRRREPKFQTLRKRDKPAWKRGLADKMRVLVNQYERMVVLKFLNSRTTFINDLRRKLRGSRIFLGKNKVLQIGLGRTEEEEIDTNLHIVANAMVGQRGILFTNKSVEEILEIFNDLKIKCDSRAKTKSPISLTLEPGLLEMFSHNQEPFLRKLGLTTRLTKVNAGSGVPELLVPFTVAVKGKRLTSAQATLLKLLGYNESHFSGRLYGVWERSSHEYTKIIKKDGVMSVAALGQEEESEDDEDEVPSAGEESDASEDEMDM